jgi:tetratricopeptide (TPR) repeat protein
LAAGLRIRTRNGAGRQNVKTTTPEVQMFSQASSTARPIIAIAAAMLMSAGAAFAAGDSDGSSSGNSGSGNTATLPQKCKEGMVWDPNAKTLFGKGKCVNAADLNKKNGNQQGMIYDYGKQLAKAGEYELAIATLKLAPDQNDPRVLNYLGFSHRKLGRMDEALGYYHAAIAQNPDFSLVREYLGEAYVQLGQLEQARAQLTEIERICGGRTCGEYGELARLIVDSQAAN